jgi:hypothetical protein
MSLCHELSHCNNGACFTMLAFVYHKECVLLCLDCRRLINRMAAQESRRRKKTSIGT